MEIALKSHEQRTWLDKTTFAIVIREIKGGNTDTKEITEDVEYGDYHSEDEHSEDEKELNTFRVKNIHGTMILHYFPFNLQKRLRWVLIRNNPSFYNELRNASDPQGEINFLPDRIWKDYASEIADAKDQVFSEVWSMLVDRRKEVLKQLRGQNDGNTYIEADYFLLTDIEVSLDIPLPYGYDPINSESFKIAFSEHMIGWGETYHTDPETTTCDDTHRKAYEDGFLETEPLKTHILNTLQPVQARKSYILGSARPAIEVKFRDRTKLTGYVKHLPDPITAAQHWLYRLEHKYRSEGSGKKAPAKIRDALGYKNRFTCAGTLQAMCESLCKRHFMNMYESFGNIAVQMTPWERFCLVKDAIQKVCPTKSLDVVELLVSGKTQISKIDILEKELCETQLKRALKMDILSKKPKKETAYTINWTYFKRRAYENEFKALGSKLLIPIKPETEPSHIG